MNEIAKPIEDVAEIHPLLESLKEKGSAFIDKSVEFLTQDVGEVITPDRAKLAGKALATGMAATAMYELGGADIQSGAAAYMTVVLSPFVFGPLAETMASLKEMAEKGIANFREKISTEA